MRRNILPTLAAAGVLALPSIAAAAARAELRARGELAVGTPAQLVITVDDDAVSPPAVDVPGVDIEYRGQMASTSIVNGRRAIETSFVYSLVPRAPGALTIPPIRVGADTTAPVRATVASASSASRGANVPASSASERDREREPTRAYVRLEVPSRRLYVGEAVPVKIRAYFRAGTAAALQGPPKLSSPAFTLSNLSEKPAQSEVVIDGVPHLQATWTAVMSPAKPMTGKLAIELPVEIAYRERRAVQRRSLRDLLGADPFGGGDPFADIDALFDDPFFQGDPFAGLDAMVESGPVRQRKLTLRHGPGRMQVVEPPAAGQPDEFAGAVGRFELALDPPVGELRVGEPTTLTWQVRGTGNFDRVVVAGIPASADWKVYPGDAKLELQANGIAGTKTFTQTIVPTRDGELEIPAVTLAYFDPKLNAYRTARTQPITVAVAAAPAGGAADAALATSSVRDPAMVATRVERGTTYATLAPMFRQPRFWTWPLALATMTMLLVGAAWWRRSPWARDFVGDRRVGRGVTRLRRELDAAARRGDAVELFATARAALQLRLGASWNVPPETITAADVDARLGEDGRVIRDIFQQADHVAYAHGSEAPGALARWCTTVHEQLDLLEKAR